MTQIRKTDTKAISTEFQDQCAVVIVDGPYRGWIGYAQAQEENGMLQVRLFDFEGITCSATRFPIEYVKNVEPKSKWD